MTRRAVLRASDADREHVAEQLRRAATEGRIAPEELDQRLGRALSARTYGDLDYLVADLPAPPARRPAAPALRHPALALAVALGVLIALAGAVFGLGPGHGHDHPGGFVFAPLIWIVWAAIGWRVFGRRASRLTR